jgi:hypothetical protein
VEVRDRINLPSLAIIGPVMQLFEAFLGAATGAQLCSIRMHRTGPYASASKKAVVPPPNK